VHRSSFWLIGAPVLAKPAVCHLAFAGGAATDARPRHQLALRITPERRDGRPPARMSALASSEWLGRTHGNPT
jgi:hypothetical protein